MSEEAISGSLQVALAHTERLLAKNPRLAAQQAEEILKVVPHHAGARLLLAAARRLSGDAAIARAVLEPLAAQSASSEVQLEMGLILADQGDTLKAVAVLQRATALQPGLGAAWAALADVLALVGDDAGADQARARQIQASTEDPALIDAALALVDGRLAVAEHSLRAYLRDQPTEPAAIRMLAEVAARLGRYEDAEALLVRCLEVAPGFHAARYNLATILNRQSQSQAALDHLELLLAVDPRNPAYANLKAAALVRIGDYLTALRLYEHVLAAHPQQPYGWMSYGHVLKTIGRSADAISAYRRALSQAPSLGEVWWSLANLKTVRFTPADRQAMEQALERSDLSSGDRYHLHYALGKALEDEGEYAQSFTHYSAGAAARRAEMVYDPEDIHQHRQRCRRLFTPAFFVERAGAGDPAADPIFVVGLPRSGSTLIEQILSSHSQVEGTMELPDVPAIVRRLSGRINRNETSAFPECLAEFSAERMAELGAEYLQRTRVQRKSDRPLFIDKMPNNFANVGLIHLMLPNAKIIDARRHPMGCCFSGFKQHFARGQGFSYSLEDIGRYYVDYVGLMADFDAALPGRVHRVIYEHMVADPEREIRALLDYCNLEFEPACLSFHETERAVRTASSEQVRQPIFREGLDQWRHYEPWLDPLKAVLGSVVDAYPAVPDPMPS